MLLDKSLKQFLIKYLSTASMGLGWKPNMIICLMFLLGLRPNLLLLQYTIFSDGLSGSLQGRLKMFCTLFSTQQKTLRRYLA